jgi:phosphate transport system substrate-binding protein
LAAFTYYAMCQAQQQSASLGYSPLPVNLVTASFDQIAKIPGAEVQNINVQTCDNPTFSPSGENLLAANAPQPQPCDRQGPEQCATGTGGLQEVATPTAPPAAGAPVTGGSTTGGSTTGGSTSGGSTSGGSTTGGSTTGGSTTGSADDDETGAVEVEEVCDPDTGICGPAGQASAGVASGGAQVGSVLPTTLDQDSGWGTTETLMLLVGLLALGLVFIPALAWRKMAQTPPAAESVPIEQSLSQDRVSV